MSGLKGLDEIFGGAVETENQFKNEEQIVQIGIDKLVDYRNGNIGKNRFTDADMDDLVESIKNNGVIQPALVRPIEKGMYEIILGHHRRDASILAGLDTLPCIVKDMDDNTAEIFWADSNIQKGLERLLHTERAELVYRRNEALKAQGKRTDLMTAEEKENLTSASEEFNLSPSSIKRYLRIYQLSNEIKELLDEGKIAIRTAVNLSYIPLDAQMQVYDVVVQNNIKLNESKSQELKENAKLGNLTKVFIEHLLLDNKKATSGVKVKSYKMKPTTFLKYFAQDQDTKEIDEILEKALEQYFSKEAV